MASKSKSIILFLIMTIIIFIAVLLFKHFNVDNSETISTPIKKIVKIKNTPKRTVHLETNQTDKEYNDTIEPLSKEQREQSIKKINNALNKAIMYDTPEKVMKAIIYYQESGDEAKAEEFIDYLLEKFPDYKM